jgi:hypothetical protein
MKEIGESQGCYAGAITMWIQAICDSVGFPRSQPARVGRQAFFKRFRPFATILTGKLTSAAYAWSWGFLLVDGSDCWGTDTTFEHSPDDTACTMSALVLSGFLASIVLLATLFLLEYLLLDRKEWTSLWTYVLLLPSVWISDASWSYWNWFSYSIANAATVGEYSSVASFAWASLIGFSINAIIFYIVHNTGRWLLINFVDKDLQIWACDLPVGFVLFGAYYGFGPFAVYLNLAADSQSKSTVAFFNALGTLFGTLLAILLFYIIPVYAWLPNMEEKPESLLALEHTSGYARNSDTSIKKSDSGTGNSSGIGSAASHYVSLHKEASQANKNPIHDGAIC